MADFQHNVCGMIKTFLQIVERIQTESGVGDLILLLFIHGPVIIFK